MEPVQDLRSCTTCHKLQPELTQPLKRSAKCRTPYCSRDCQKDDWKDHKIICSPQASSKQDSTTAASSSTGAHNPGFHSVNQLLGLSNDDHLHKLPGKEAFIQLIGCFRMRIEDEYTYGGKNLGIYGGDSSVPAFRKFLTLAKKREGLLPSWWSEEKRKECERLAMGGDLWADIDCAVEKSDIQEHYNNPTMPMVLRILGEKIYGRGFM